jgi:acyl dehydratase
VTCVPITPDHVGRTYPRTVPYQVSAAKIVEFASALGDDNPAFRGDEAVAPPTFVSVLAARAWASLFDDDELGLALRRTVHTDQGFRFHRPLRAGDRVTAALTIDKVRTRRESDLVGCSVRIETDEGELVCIASATFLHAHQVS